MVLELLLRVLVLKEMLFIMLSFTELREWRGFESREWNRGAKGILSCSLTEVVMSAFPEESDLSFRKPFRLPRPVSSLFQSACDIPSDLISSIAIKHERISAVHESMLNILHYLEEKTWVLAWVASSLTLSDTLSKKCIILNFEREIE